MFQSSFYKCTSFSDGGKDSGAASPALPAGRVAVAFAATHLLLQQRSSTGKSTWKMLSLPLCIFKQEKTSGPAWDQAKAH